MKYIYILEGTFGRIDTNATNQNLGLCTDNIDDCKILVLASADKKRQVLMHVDPLFNFNTISEQLSWLGTDASAEIFYRAKADYLRLTEFLSKIGSPYKLSIIAEENEAILANTDQPITKAVKMLPGNVIYHPKALELYVKNRINNNFDTSHNGYHTPLIFDVSMWSDNSQDLILTKVVQAIFLKWNINENMRPDVIYDLFPEESDMHKAKKNALLASDMFLLNYLQYTSMQSTARQSESSTSKLNLIEFVNFSFRFIQNNEEFEPYKDFIDTIKKMNDVNKMQTYVQFYLYEKVAKNQLSTALRSLINFANVYANAYHMLSRKYQSKLINILEGETKEFFEHNQLTWKKYPADKLVGSYTNHDLCYLNLPNELVKATTTFTEHLNKFGFHAEARKNTKVNTSSVIVDLTCSQTVTLPQRANKP